MKRRQQQKDEAEVVEEGEISEDTVEKMSEDAMETDQPLSSDIVTADESLEDSFKSLEQDYQLRLEELQAAKCSAALGRGFPDETMLKGDDKMCSFYTGLPSYTIIMSLFRYTTRRLPESSANKLTNFQCFLLTLMKLRLNLSNFDLAFRFCIHETTVGRIITKWLQLMDIRMTLLIQWPDRERTKATMPWCFRSHYGLSVTSIIDCFEIFIEKPMDLMSKTATWSSYKHYNTVKYLISITPQGTVNFISKGYAGRVSDKYITEDCGYLNKLQAGDVVLADRGFNVEDSVAYRGATLNIPAFTTGKSQLSPGDVESTRRLANVRIHVERVIGSVRQKFQILSATTPLPTQYTRSKNGGPIILDSIVRVSCALHNACDIIVSAT